MSAPLQSRQTILDSIRLATLPCAQDSPDRAEAYAALPRDYVRHGQLDANARLKLMIERLREYDADVVESSPTELPAVIKAQLTASGRHSFVAPEQLPAAWLAAGFEWKTDRGLTTNEIEQAQGVVTTAFCGIADSGTIVLHHSATEGRRVLSLLPDWHLIVLRASQVVETLPEYFEQCKQPPALVTWISGPSATADIEMTRIKGVHGPRFLNVIVVRDESLLSTKADLRPAETGSAKGRKPS
ncbi:MAG: lactate utilization protein C [Terracidiphilus sp.]|jgi:L-lactate dehydrogenase complex protein LldG